jgi:hypothetical protein
LDKNNWILCAIESPQEGEEILLTFKNKVGFHVGEATFKKDTYFYVAETDNGYYESPYGMPVAWMSKPEPYKVE